MRKLAPFFALLVIAMASLPIAPAPAADLLISSIDGDSVPRFDGVTGSSLGYFVPPESGGLHQPQGIAFGPDGNLYVVNRGRGGVLKFDGHSGDFLVEVVPPGAGGLDTPIGLCFGPDWNLYVGGIYSHNVARFTPDGYYLGDFVTPRSGGLDQPYGLTFGPDGDLYVASHNNDRVLRYRPDGSFLDAFVPPLSGGLCRPTGLTFGPDGDLYVVDNWNCVVRRYQDKTGVSRGIYARGNLFAPSGLAFDPEGNLLVCSRNWVVRYQKNSGQYQGLFILPGVDNLDYPGWPVFDPYPKPPQDLSAKVFPDGRVLLTWQDVSDNKTAFIIERKSGDGFYQEIARLPAGTTRHWDTTVSPHTSYTYHVRGTTINSFGMNFDGYYSNEVEVTIP